MAVPRPQHSPILGQRASSHTVCSWWLRIRCFSSMYPGLPGIFTLSHSGSRGRMATLWSCSVMTSPLRYACGLPCYHFCAGGRFPPEVEELPGPGLQWLHHSWDHPALLRRNDGVYFGDGLIEAVIVVGHPGNRSGECGSSPPGPRSSVAPSPGNSRSSVGPNGPATRRRSRAP